MTFDPYTNKTPWGLLTEEERSIFKEADDKNVLRYCYDRDNWYSKGAGTLFAYNTVYRLAQTHIDYCFDLFEDKFEWAATSESGTVVLYEMKPIKSDGFWLDSGGDVTLPPEGLKRYPTLPAGVSWEDSLRRRDGV